MTDIKAATMLTNERINSLWSEATTGFHGDITVVDLFAHAIEAEVLAQAGVTAEPAGWKLVPIKLTPEMRAAWDKAPQNEDDDIEFAGAYQAMIDAAPTIRAQVPAAEVRSQALHTLNNDGWKIDGSLIYRLNDEGFNCDEINVTMVNGSRAADLRHDAAVELLTELTSIAQVPTAEVRAALEMARSYIDATSTEPGYGFVRPDNPHDFHPDAESCSAEEIAAHKAACEAYDKGEYTPGRGSEWVGTMHILRAPWGIGTYTMRDEHAIKVLAAIDSSLAQQSTADKASEVRAAEWISVEDRLPEENDEVLICGDRRHDEGKYQAVSKYSNGFFFDDDHNEDGEYINVTHWRPLPAAPSTADSANTGALGEKGAEA